MANVLVVFESTYGQAEKIAAHIADQAVRRGHATKLRRAKEARYLDLHAEDAVFVVSPVYFGGYPRAIEDFVRAQADILAHRRSAFVSVGNGAASQHPVDRARAMRVARRFVAKTGFRPSTVTPIAGAIAYPSYGLVLRMVMKAIAKREGLPTDTSMRHELTDWALVDYATNGVLDGVELVAAAAE